MDLPLSVQQQKYSVNKHKPCTEKNPVCTLVDQFKFSIYLTQSYPIEFCYTTYSQ